MGGMGRYGAMAAAARVFGVEIRTSAAVAQIDSRAGTPASCLEDGTEIALASCFRCRSQADFFEDGSGANCRRIFAEAVRGIKMDGPCAKVNMVLSEEPCFTDTPAHYDAQQRSLFTLIPSLEFAECCYDVAKFGEIPEQLWVDCVIASNADPSLAPAGKHIMTCFVSTPFTNFGTAHGTRIANCWGNSRRRRLPSTRQRAFSNHCAAGAYVARS
jgi:phytoene dehydrogenase-like protein